MEHNQIDDSGSEETHAAQQLAIWQQWQFQSRLGSTVQFQLLKSVKILSRMNKAVPNLEEMEGKEEMKAVT